MVFKEPVVFKEPKRRTTARGREKNIFADFQGTDKVLPDKQARNSHQGGQAQARNPHQGSVATGNELPGYPEIPRRGVPGPEPFF